MHISYNGILIYKIYPIRLLVDETMQAIPASFVTVERSSPFGQLPRHEAPPPPSTRVLPRSTGCGDGLRYLTSRRSSRRGRLVHLNSISVGGGEPAGCVEETPYKITVHSSTREVYTKFEVV